MLCLEQYPHLKSQKRDFASPQVTCSLSLICMHSMVIIIQLCSALKLPGLQPEVFIRSKLQKSNFSWLQIRKQFWMNTFNGDLEMQVYVRSYKGSN